MEDSINQIRKDGTRHYYRHIDHGRRLLHDHSSILYALSLLRIVFTSRPSWRAASALLWPVFSRVLRISSRSASAAVMPKGSTIFVEDSVVGFRRYGGRWKVSTHSPRARMRARSMTFRNSR